MTRQQSIAYQACNQIRRESYLFELLGLTGSREQKSQQLNLILHELIEHKIMLQDGNKYLSLSVSINKGFFPPESLWANLNELFEPSLEEHSELEVKLEL